MNLVNILDIKPANGVSGMLLWTGENYCFRVYDKENDTFVDYNVLHSDLSVTINDADSAFYIGADGKNTLDHSPETLGIRK